MEELKIKSLPRHLAIIMDGNGRWAKEKGKLRVFGHEQGVKTVRRTVEDCARIGLEYLTLYTFSTENWNRPKLEVDTLMRLLVSSLKKELKTLNKNNIRLNTIGNIASLPNNAHKELLDVMGKTSANTGMTLTLALSYGSREEIKNAVQQICVKVKNNIISPENIDETIINNHLYTQNLPDVDLLIRTSGEHRISNFLLWQIAYAELYFIDVFWPDFSEQHLLEAIKNYQNRERRFGKLANNSPSGMNRFMSLELFITLLFLIFTTVISAQDTSYEDGKKYILGGLEVTGLQSYNEQTVKTYTGLRIGQSITVPGDEISAVINKLWGLELFTDISFYITNIEGENVFLELNIIERPTLTNVTVYGVKKGKIEEILKDTDLKKGKKITESLIANSKNYIQNKYKKKGYLNAQVSIATAKDTVDSNTETMVINVKKGDKVKINDIVFEGNEQLSDKKLAKAMKKTKKKKFYRFWKKSKYIEEDYKTDLVSLVDKYAENGYRDARIVSDTFVRVSDDLIDLKIKVEEGNKYYFGDIDFVGNTVYSDRQLAQMLGIKKGDTYNGVLLRKRIADDTKPDAEDLTNMYQNFGYLFSSINPVEISADNDTINFEIRIIEGKETFLDHVTVVGNDKTNDHVIFRELRTRPGQRYNKSDIIRSIRELGQLGFFDAEQIKPDIQNPDPNAGTVDIQYSLVEAGSSQIELQGGYGGGGFIGTLGLSFSNFSMKNLFNGEAYKPVPMGDGQTFALRLQASRTYRVYSLNFSEPWLGGKKPVRFNMSLSRTQQFYYNPYVSNRPDKSRQFSITGITAGLAKRVQWPDDFFTISHSLGYQLYNFQDYNLGLFNFGNGKSNSIAYTLGISRNATGGGRIYPRSGSNFEVTAKFTPPFSLFNNIDYKQLNEDLEVAIEERDNEEVERIDQERFKWLEFYKVNFKGDWYTSLVGDLVLRTNAEFGFLGNYNEEVGKVPFERFFVGGDGMGAYTLDGRDVIALRGYENQSLTPYGTDLLSGGQVQDGGVVYNKYSLELRYPLTLKPSASIYGQVFLEAGNAFNNFQDFNPFELKRSAGVGLRIFMPAFGLLGIDFGYGFDQDYNPNSNGPSGWQTHFIIGQQF